MLMIVGGFTPQFLRSLMMRTLRAGDASLSLRWSHLKVMFSRGPVWLTSTSQLCAASAGDRRLCARWGTPSQLVRPGSGWHRLILKGKSLLGAGGKEPEHHSASGHSPSRPRRRLRKPGNPMGSQDISSCRVHSGWTGCGVAVGGTTMVGVGVIVGVGVTVGVGTGVGVGVDVGGIVGVGVGSGVGEGPAVGVGVTVGSADTVGVGRGDGVSPGL